MDSEAKRAGVRDEWAWAGSARTRWTSRDWRVPSV